LAQAEKDDNTKSPMAENLIQPNPAMILFHYASRAITISEIASALKKIDEPTCIYSRIYFYMYCKTVNFTTCRKNNVCQICGFFPK
jgi:hypothetical protein